VKHTAELAGFFAAHAVWCVCEGEALTPLAAYERVAGDRNLVRFADERLEAGVERGKQWLAENPEQAQRAVFVYDAYVTLPTGKTDALMIEMRSFGDSDWSLTMALPYRNAAHAQGFAVHRPKFLAFAGPGKPDYEALGEAFFAGVAKHEKGAAVWNEHLDESR
jgi:hypothetical protein